MDARFDGRSLCVGSGGQALWGLVLINILYMENFKIVNED